MVLTHRERLTARQTQRQLMQERVRTGQQLTPMPSPGVYARHNAVDVPALQPDGTPAPESLPRLIAGPPPPGRRVATPAALTQGEPLDGDRE
jgi:NADH-quinone oxidoreductase subunit J